MSTNIQSDLIGLIAHWSFDEAEGKKVLNKVTGKSSEINYVFNNAKFKPASDPVRIPGAAGNALLFDGFSTWIENNEGILGSKKDEFSIEVWAAPRCNEYNQNNNITAIINQYNEENKEGFILGLKAFGVLSFKIAINGRWYGFDIEDNPLPLNKWSQLTAVFNGTKGYIEIYINGNRAGKKEVPEFSFLASNNEKLIIGKTNNSIKINDVYEVACYCGALDELKVYNKALSSGEVLNIYNEYASIWNKQLPEPDLSIDRKIFEGDRYRPVYHLISPGYWMNEPHGPLYFQGKYHLFFQHNPHGPLWRQIHWGHVVSDDMVHWRDLPCALVPEKDKIDCMGDWSGCAFVDNGVPAIMYTAGDGPVYSQCAAIARSTYEEDRDIELKKWIKHDTPIILQDKGIKTSKGEAYYGQFRDPFVWKEEDTYYAIIGSGIKNCNGSAGGTALLYTSVDLYNWEYRKPLYMGDYNKYPKTGEVWELPVFLPIGKDREGKMKHILLINPWFFKPSPYNVKYVWYWIGSWDKDNLQFTLDSDIPELLDVGEHFTGPSGIIDPKGRTIIFSIAQGKRTSEDECSSGWAHNGGLPISLYLREDGRLGLEPISELESLRERKYVNLENKSLIEVNKAIEFIKDDCMKIELEICGGMADRFGIKLRKTPDGEEETLLYYDMNTKEILVNRNKSTINPESERGVQGGAVDIGEDNLKLHIYIDKSMVEAYVNKLKALTTRVYPTRENALGLSIWADKNVDTVKVKKMIIWKLKSAYL